MSEVDLTRQYAVPYSGGIDSECVLELLYDAGADVTAYTVDMYIDGILINEYDTNYAKQYTRTRGINHTVIDLDLNQFLDNEMFEYAHKYRVISPQLSMHLWLLDCIPTTEVIYLPGDPIEYKQMSNRIMFKDYMYLYTYRYFNSTKRPFELLLDGSSVAINETLKYKIRCSRENETDYQYKCNLYKHLGFSAEPKVDKYTGFEKLRQYFSDKYNEKYTIREFNNRYRLPLEAVIKEPEMTYIYPKYMTDLIERLRNG